MTDEQYTAFKQHRQEFEDVFNEDNTQGLIDILNDHPDNIREADDDNPEKRIIDYSECTKRTFPL